MNSSAPQGIGTPKNEDDYEAPAFVVLGTVADLTQGSTQGSVGDGISFRGPKVSL